MVFVHFSTEKETNMTNYGQREMQRMNKSLRRQDHLERFLKNGFVRFLGLVLAGLVGWFLLVSILGTPEAFPEIIPFH